MNELLFLFVAKIHWVIKEIITEMMSAHVQGIPLAPSFQAHQGAAEETGLRLAAAGSLLMMSLSMETSC